MELHDAIRNQPKCLLTEYTDRNFVSISNSVLPKLPMKNDLNYQDEKGNTPLHTALMVGWKRGDYLTMYAVIKALLEAGANTKLKNNVGYTPIGLINYIIETSEEDDDYLYLKRRDHNQYRRDIGVMVTVANNLFQSHI